MISEKKYPDPVLEEPILAFGPLSAALPMIYCGENSSQGLSELHDLSLGLLQSGEHLFFLFLFLKLSGEHFDNTF